MITPTYVATMAAYNRWQNVSLFGAAGGLTHEARTMDRGAFFGSVQRTLSHLAWGDTIWLSRFGPMAPPGVPIERSADWIPDWESLAETRATLDAEIDLWASRISTQALAGELSFYSGSLGRDVTSPMALCVAHFFNHQTHHRGQVHGMLTAAGAKPDPTDLFAMPSTY
ncbi:MAG: DinB family protein, partial [Pseudomonadota bacterium]